MIQEALCDLVIKDDLSVRQLEDKVRKLTEPKKQKEEEAAKAAAKKEYDAKKGIVTEEEDSKESKALSGIADRPYCKGRAYDPNRYNNTEE